MVSPEYRKVIPENIPDELKARNQWVVWKSVPAGVKSKPGKVPISLRINKATGEKEIGSASCNDPKTWMAFEDAISLLNSSKEYQGLQIALTPKPPDDYTDRLIGIDFDQAVLPDGSIKPELLEEVQSFNTYFELSPTDGLRGFCYGHFPVNEGVHKGNIETYQYGKFLTVTGHQLTDAHATVEPAQEALTALRAKHFSSFSEINENNLPVTPVSFTDEELLIRLLKSKLSDKFKNLYYEKASEVADHSVLDKNLCGLLAFWTQDKEQIDRLFRTSVLFRDKWNEVHGHDSNGPLTYGQMTINYALKTRKRVFNPRNKTQNKDELVQNKAPSTFSCCVYPYFITESGIYKQKHNQNRNSDEIESTDESLCPTPCLITAVGVNIDTGDILYKLYLKDSRGNEKILWKKPSDLLKKVEAVKLLDEGMHFKESDSTEMIKYFDKFITQYQDVLPEEIVASKSGWKNDFSLFVVGDKAISATGIQTVLQKDNPIAEVYTQKGELGPVVEVINMLRKYDAVSCKLYTACTPPILKLLNIHSFVETQQTPSGRLKTTMGLLAASIWGDPERLQLNAESTRAGIQKNVAFCTDLPIFVDETSITDNIKDMVYLIANGVGRSKSNSEGGLVMPSTWSTVVLTTGEKPILSESALMGQQVRVVPLRDGVSEKLPRSTVKQILNAITTNYGHLGILFLQRLFKEKDNIKSLYNAFFNDFPEMEDITSDREKEYYAAIATAGYLLEQVFEEIKVDTKNSSAVCKHYFDENVISNSFISDYIKALSATYSFFSGNEIYFQDEDEEHPLNHERYGWIRKDPEHGSCICFIPDKLRKHLNTEIGPNTYEAVTDEWKNLGILIPKIQKNQSRGSTTRLKKNEISVNKRKIQVIKIPLTAFAKYLKLDNENKEKLEYSEVPEDNNEHYTSTTLQAQEPFKTPSERVKIATSLDDFEKIAGVTAADGHIIVTDDDTELAEIMKQRGY